jgi:hypothetical protein
MFLNIHASQLSLHPHSPPLSRIIGEYNVEKHARLIVLRLSHRVEHTLTRRLCGIHQYHYRQSVILVRPEAAGFDPNADKAFSNLF